MKKYKFKINDILLFKFSDTLEDKQTLYTVIDISDTHYRLKLISTYNEENLPLGTTFSDHINIIEQDYISVNFNTYQFKGITL